MNKLIKKEDIRVYPTTFQMINREITHSDMRNKKKNKLDWKKIWKSFDRWFDYKAKDFMWETQQKQIEKIVNRQLSDE